MAYSPPIGCWTCVAAWGPARYLAHKIGCQVVGVDLTRSRLESAQRLTQLVGLDSQVSFQWGNALDLPFPDASFDVVMSQQAWCHVPDKPRLIGQCARVLKPGGVLAFTDILRTPALSADEVERLGIEMIFNDLGAFDQYLQLMRAQGFQIAHSEELGALWAQILVARLAMYRGMQGTTANKFGDARRDQWDRYYSFFVGLYQQGKLSGGRFVARKT
ncbi:MAG: methyltransferase domain-containing protein [Betaproteobacteria bacterium]|nr:methyltransferase domain-containing protein [Betaproteobacteria bacterium]